MALLIVLGGIVWLKEGLSDQKPLAFPENPASLDEVKPVLGKEAPEALFYSGGREIYLSEFRGKKIMFWLLATWCPSCVAGAKVLDRNNDKLGSLKIIALQTYGNAGYPGIQIEEFAREYVPQLLTEPNWLWGEASQETTRIYNPRNLPDIYFLIDENGVIRVIDTAPAATVNKIIEFGNE